MSGMNSSQLPVEIGTMMTSEPTICVVRVMVASAHRSLPVTIRTKVSVTVLEINANGTLQILQDVERMTLKTLWLLPCAAAVKVVVTM